jgi:hypothetical protein
MHGWSGVAAAALPPELSGTAAIYFYFSIHINVAYISAAALKYFEGYICGSAASGIAASMHSQRHGRQHAFTAALPPACIHSGLAASMHSQRPCRQHALIYSGVAACSIQRQCRL